MKLPYLMSCTDEAESVILYPLKDGRFQIVSQGKIAPLLNGNGYALIEEKFAEYLERLDLPQLIIDDAIIYDPKNKIEIQTHRQMHIGQHFSADMIRDINLDGERMLLMDNSHIFVSSLLKKRLESAGFQYLQFSEGLSDFAT